ncbi:MAG: integrin alpha [Planctomycetota bacterium]
MLQWLATTSARLVICTVIIFPAAAQIMHGTIDGGLLDGVTRAEVIGDIDGDGTGDLAVCLYQGGIASNGAILVVSGRTLQPLLPRIEGLAHESWAFWVTGAGDFNGDGTPDFVRGTPDWGLGAAPQFRVYSGRDASLLHVFPDPGVNDWGAAVAPLGDVDGDGFDDLILGEEYGDDFYIYGGPDGHLIRTHVDLGGAFMPARSIGDINLDGVPDYAIGIASLNRVRVYSGASGAVVHDVVGQGLFSIGIDVCGVGDLDGDGRVEFAACAGVGRFQNAAPGEVFVFRGSNAEVLFHFQGEGTTLATVANLGMFLDGGRDVNGDGVPDLIASAPLPFNQGGEPGYINVYSLRTGTLLWNRRRTPHVAERLEYCRFYGDLDGDGLSEWGFGDSHADYAAFGAGRIWIYKGAFGDADEFCPATPSSSGQPARLVWDGPTSVGHPRMALHIEGAPPSTFAVFFYGVARAPASAGSGFLCLGPPIVRLSQPVATDAAGRADLSIDWLSGPQVAGPAAWTVGSAWALQAFYRDAPGPTGAPFNSTSASRVVFLP